MLRFSLTTLAALICVATCTRCVHADLLLDTTFASDGIAEIDLDANLDSARDIAVQADGKYVLAGLSTRTSGADTFDYAAITRVKDDGSVDPDFGDGGTTAILPGGTPLNFGGADARAIAIQPDDQKIVVAGNWNVNDGSGNHVFVLRLLTDGSPDDDFGTAGVTILDLPSLTGEQTEDVALQSDGGIIVSGAASIVGFILRLTSGGTLDGTFADSGVFSTEDPSNPGASMSFNAVKVTDGDAIAATGGIFDIVVAKLSSSGQPDTGFDGDGIATFNVDSFDLEGNQNDTTDNANGLAVQTDGKILVVGSTQHPTVFENAIMVARVTTAGALDSTFGTSGYAFLPNQPTEETAYDIAIRPSGDTVVAGVGFKPVQVSPNGKAFGVLPGGFAPQSINGLAALDDGRVVGGGEQNISGANYEMIAIRLDATDLADPQCPPLGELTGDCKITASDALVGLKMAVGAIPEDLVADMDCNGSVAASDALKILRVAVGVDQQPNACI